MALDHIQNLIGDVKERIDQQGLEKTVERAQDEFGTYDLEPGDEDYENAS